MRNKKNTLYIILAAIVVVVGIVILLKDNSKDKKDETTKSEQMTTTDQSNDRIKENNTAVNSNGTGKCKNYYRSNRSTKANSVKHTAGYYNNRKTEIASILWYLV